MLTLPVRLGLPGGVSGLVDDIIDPSFSVPIGLLLYGSKQEMVESGGFKFPSKFNIPGKSVINKVIESIKDLLP